MKHETNKAGELQIIDGLYTFEEIYKKPYCPQDLIENIRKSTILFLPYEDFRDRNDFLFPEQTYELYSFFLENNNNPDMIVDICVSDSEYKELELHSNCINIPHLITQYALLPIVTSMIANFLYEKLRNNNRKASEVSTNIKLTVEKTGKSKTINYEGSIENFEKAMNTIDEHIFK